MFSTGFGIEIEFTGITRAQAAQVAAGYLGGRVESSGDYYNTQKIHTPDGRVWKIMSDGSIRTQKKAGGQVLSATGEFSVELVSPILHYESDIETHGTFGLVSGTKRKRRTGETCGRHR